MIEETYIEQLGFKAATIAMRAGDKDVAQKLHFHFFVTQSFTVLASAIARIEGETGGCIAFGFRFGQLPEEFANFIQAFTKTAGFDRGVRLIGV